MAVSQAGFDVVGATDFAVSSFWRADTLGPGRWGIIIASL
jgi:hypothetical protein